MKLKRRSAAVDFAETSRMHYLGGEQTLRHPSTVPEWSSDDHKVQIVVFAWLWNYCVASGLKAELRPGMSVGDLERLALRARDEYLKRATKPTDAVNLRAHVEQTGNGLAGHITRLIYLAYRRGLRSTDIAQEMEMSPVAVRQKLHRINVVAARTLGATLVLQKHRSGPRHQLTPERQAEVVRAYREVQTIEGVAKKLGHATLTVRNILQRHGVLLYQPQVPAAEEPLIAEWAERYRNGETGCSIAQAYHTTPNRVFRYLKRAGVSTRTRGRRHLWTQQEINQIAGWRNGGATLGDIAELVCCSKTTVARLLKLAAQKAYLND